MVRPVVDVCEPSTGGIIGARAGRDDEAVVRELLPVDLDDAGPRDRASPRTNAQRCSSSHVELILVVPVARRPSRATHQTPSASGRSGARPGRAVERRRELGRAQHRLRRHARVVRALAADEPALDERDLRVGVEPAEGADEMLAGRPSAEDDDLHLLETVRLEEGGRDLRGRLLVDRRPPCSWPDHRARASASRRPRSRPSRERCRRPRRASSTRPVRRSGTRRCASCPSSTVYLLALELRIGREDVARR